MFSVKGESYKGERVYIVRHKQVYQLLSKDKSFLRQFVRKMAEVLCFLSAKGIVHADLKGDNILIEIEGSTLRELKLIDFGSAFKISAPDKQITAATPEYLPPEVLVDKNDFEALQEPWSFDVWSLGICLVELMTGIPIWMSLKCKTSTFTTKSSIGTGLLGVPGRDPKKILAKLHEFLKSWPPHGLGKYECYGLNKD